MAKALFNFYQLNATRIDFTHKVVRKSLLGACLATSKMDIVDLAPTSVNITSPGSNPWRSVLLYIYYNPVKIAKDFLYEYILMNQRKHSKFL